MGLQGLEIMHLNGPAWIDDWIFGILQRAWRLMVVSLEIIKISRQHGFEHRTSRQEAI